MTPDPFDTIASRVSGPIHEEMDRPQAKIINVYVRRGRGKNVRGEYKSRVRMGRRNRSVIHSVK